MWSQCDSTVVCAQRETAISNTIKRYNKDTTLTWKAAAFSQDKTQFMWNTVRCLYETATALWELDIFCYAAKCLFSWRRERLIGCPWP